MPDSDIAEVVKIEYQVKDRWSERNSTVAEYIPAGSSILDLGCGDKDILNYVECSDYWGVDLCKYADQIHDFDDELLTWDRKWDIGLLLGVIYYPHHTDRFLSHYKQFADKWIVVINPKTILLKDQWNHCFNEDTMPPVLLRHFSKVSSRIDIPTTIPKLGRSHETKTFQMWVCEV